jgi:hypothetical protein
MTQLTDVFQPICQEVQTKLKGVLRGLFGGMVKGYLPQKWIFRTDSETVTFSVAKAGTASVEAGEGSPPDVIITIDHDYLLEALKTRRRPGFQPRNINVEFKTGKGQTAFNYIGKELGL